MYKKKRENKVYSPEFKILVIEDLRTNNLSYHEIMRKYFSQLPSRNFKFIKVWERIYLTEGAEGLMKERRGRATKAGNPNIGRPLMLDKQVEEDLITENQRLRAENEYLKKLHALALSKIKLENEKKPR